jgi:hypothetical protein
MTPTVVPNAMTTKSLAEQGTDTMQNLVHDRQQQHKTLPSKITTTTTTTTKAA